MTEHAWPRAILHVDMDAFYASVEEREDPTLAGKAVIVGGPKDTRGVVSACNYEARRFGVHSAMPLRTAARLCPHGVYLPVRMQLYAQVSRQVFAIFERFSPLVEPLSVDEAFLDLTGSDRLLGGPVEAARAIRRAIQDELHLTASVGVAPNKFVAKIASDFDKPDGLVVVPAGTVESFLAPLPVERMWGIGPRGAKALHRRGIRTFADLARHNIQPEFGTAAHALRALATGEDARPVVTRRAPKSVSHETTFSENVTDAAVLHNTFVSLTDRVAARLRAHGLRARTIAIKVRYAPFRTMTRRITLDAPTHVTGTLLSEVLDLAKKKLPRDGGPVRLLGVSASGFSAQPTLFDPRGAQEVDRAVDSVRAKFGAAALKRGSVLDTSDG